MIYPSIHDGTGMQMYELEETYHISEKEKKILEHIEGIEDIEFLEKYKHHLKPKRFFNTICFLLDPRLSERYFVTSQTIKKRKNESESIGDKL